MTDLSFVETQDGTRLGYRVVGSGPARVALTHSLAMDHAFWLPVAEKLADRAQVLVWDCRGHGASGKPEGPYAVRGFADDLAAIFDAIGWSDAAVAGASMGGCVTLAFAERYPDRTAALGLFDTTAWYGASAPQDWEGRAAKAEAEGLSSLIAFQKTRWFGDAFRAAQPEVVEACVDVFLKNDLAAYGATCRMLGRADLREALEEIDVPTRILVGEEDYATPPEMSRMMASAIAGSVLTVLEGGRHLTPIEFPEVIADEIAQLIGEVQS
ncbi:MAG: alpha/beta fold hydrolase [Pseudomonadota bacterium]|nr:alpha/beta fold hydrolase [Pseudomonadota bacterium]